MNISIREIVPEEVWPIRHVVMYPDMDFESIKLPEDKDGLHLGLFDGEVLVSIVSLFTNNNELQFRKFATLKDYQAKGYGSTLLEYVINFAKQENINRMWCNARKNATGFYRKFEFVETNETFFKDGYYFVVMERML